MDLRWLNNVLTLVDEGNLGRAAARNAITRARVFAAHPRVRDLAGADILDRHANRVEIRPVVREVETDLRALVLHLQELSNHMNLGSGASGHAVVAARHSLTLSAVAGILTRLYDEIEPLSYRLRSANRNECISICLRGDADVLLCHDIESDPPLPLDDSFQRWVWSTDRLVPVVGGKPLYAIDKEGSPPHGTP